MTPSDLRVTIAGAGTGGLAAALLLAHRGARVTVFEQADEPRAVGAGIGLQPNGLAVLAGLGLGRAIHAVGASGRVGRLDNGSGRILAEIVVTDWGGGHDHVLIVRRSDLINILFEAAQNHPGITIHLGAQVTAADREGTVSVATGSRRENIGADLVIGADGLHSRIRAQGRFGVRLRPSLSYVRGLSPARVTDTCTESWTSHGIFGTIPLLDGTYFFSSAGTPELRQALADRDLAAYRRVWANACRLAGKVLASVEEFEELLVNQVVRVDCSRWADGRFVLLGDAAHAMSPNFGQGANSALVDGAVLAFELSREPDLGRALDHYQARRRPAVRRVQNAAEGLSLISERTNPVLRGLRDTVLPWLVRAASPGALRNRERMLIQEEPVWLEAQASIRR